MFKVALSRRHTALWLADSVWTSFVHPFSHVNPCLHRDEVFLTSAVRGILPVTTVDSVRIGHGQLGSLTRRLLDLYQRLVSEAR